MTRPNLTDGRTANLTVGTISPGTVLRCAPETTLARAIEMMREVNCSSIIITKDNLPVGIWTEKDCLALPTDCVHALDEPISNWMSAPVHSISLHASPEAAMVRMRERHVRHLVTIDEKNRLAGIISQSDLIRHQGSLRTLGEGDVGDAIRRTTIFVDGDISMSELRARMHEAKCDCAIIYDPTVKTEQVSVLDHAGIITERDILQNLANGGHARPAIDIASHPLHVIAAKTSLSDARDTMLNENIRHLAVIDDTRNVIGVLSFADLLEFIEQDYFAHLRALMEGRDTELSAARRSLFLANKIIETSPDGIMICTANGIIELVNPAFTRVTGYSASDVIGKNPRILQSGRQSPDFYAAMWRSIQQHGKWEGEIWNRRKSGEVYPEWLSIIAIRNGEGEICQYASIFTDISERKKNREDILRLAHIDELTGYPNRRRFLELLAHGIGDSRRNGTSLTILLLDIDNFQRVNNTLGHSDGDDVLVEVARRLHRRLDEGGVLARVGADEYAILLSGDKPSDKNAADDTAEDAKLAKDLLDALSEPHKTRKGQDIYISASIGIASFPRDANDTANLLRNAEIAMMQSKEQGRNQFSRYNRASHSRNGADLALETALRQALDNDEFHVVYQPQFQARTGELHGVEALLRWNHPTLGPISPTTFIPIAEQMGVIGELGRWVLQHACRQAVSWREQGLHNITMAVNVSVQQFYGTVDLAEQIRTILVDKGLASDRLEIEITESLFMQNIDEMRANLQRIRDLGVKISLDDFGTGFSSLSYLRQLPFDTIKLDRSFVSDINQGREGNTLAITIINMAQNLHKKCVAEGVETEEQLNLLRDAGCDYIQGYLLGKPMDADDILSLSQQRRAKAS
ncbi:EAL domain-containing protein [Thalassospira alkalitolerans]|uniref:EAL domain-containing protein n=1 Tax=Thalassospira alkalitolerans TaxID=1293890 RepID=UPI003AA96086|tara:strand:- start:81547 stop:84135 length:2589 start_codon:yes stop_codon:yes gene_type:complete